MKNLLEKYNCDISRDSVWIHAIPSTAAKSTFFYVQEAGRFKCRSNYYTQRENLDSFLILYTASGAGRLEYGGNSYSVLPGQALLIDCINPHSYCVDSPDGWDIRWIHFKGATSRNYYELYQKSCPTVLKDISTPSFEQTLEEILDRHENFTADTERICSKLIVSLLTDLLAGSSESFLDTASMPSYIHGVISILEKNYAKNISLDELSHTFSISKYHLERIFRKFIGVSIHEYHIQLRMNLAKDLLKSSSLPISEISRTVGIDNISHFNSLFKNRTSETPASYRRKWQTLD